MFKFGISIRIRLTAAAHATSSPSITGETLYKPSWILKVEGFFEPFSWKHHTESKKARPPFPKPESYVWLSSWLEYRDLVIRRPDGIEHSRQFFRYGFSIASAAKVTQRSSDTVGINIGRAPIILDVTATYCPKIDAIAR
jgi:hypothetical protein